MNTLQLKFNLIDKLIALKEMLMASEDDIKHGRIISDDELNEEEYKWLNEQ